MLKVPWLLLRKPFYLFGALRLRVWNPRSTELYHGPLSCACRIDSLALKLQKKKPPKPKYVGRRFIWALKRLLFREGQTGTRGFGREIDPLHPRLSSQALAARSQKPKDREGERNAADQERYERQTLTAVVSNYVP